MKTSEQLDKILPALMTVKSKLQAVTKGANNPFFKSKYADLNTYLDEVEPLLQGNQMVLFQPVSVDPVSGANIVSSRIMHESGQFIESSMAINGAGLDAQKMGAAVTYLRRFTLGPLLAMRAIDDDGEEAVGRGKHAKTAPEAAVASSSEAPATQAKPSFKDRYKSKTASKPVASSPAPIPSAAPAPQDDL